MNRTIPYTPVCCRPRPSRIFRPVLSAVLVCAALVGCQSFGGRSESAASMGYAEDAVAATAPAPAPAPVQSKAAAPGSTPLAPSTPLLNTTASTARESRPPDEAPKRLRVYSGYLELVVNEPEETRASVMNIAETSGGYVESTSGEYLVIRVPAERFFAIFEGLAELGEVRARSIETADVTEQFTDLERRIHIARETRQRLYTLLEDTEDVDERVRILREIRRLTEEIDQLESARDVMAAQISMSRITVRLTPRIDETSGVKRGIPFRWIAELNPLRMSTGKAEGKIEINLPADFALLEVGERIRAESAEGTRFRFGVVGNDPRGDTTFWYHALEYHLSDLYRSIEPVETGDFRGVIFTSKDVRPFQYLVAVRVRGGDIEVAEAFFPDSASRERRLDSLLQTLGGVK